MRVLIKCDKKRGGCGFEYEVEAEFIKNEKYIQCPNPKCGKISLNPFYKGDK